MSRKSPTQREMPLAEWLAVPVWPNQRNTKAHGLKLTRRKDFDPHHPSLGHNCGLVTVAGKTYKVNGITTTYLHEIGKCFYPKVIHALHYYCDTMEEGQSIYNSFDPAWAGKGAKDRLVSAISNANIALKSSVFANGKGTTGLSLTYNACRSQASTAAPVDVDAMVVALKADIIAVDALDLAGDIAGGTVTICAAMLSHRVARKLSPDRRDAAVRDWKLFWTNFYMSRGQKIGSANAAYNVLWHHIVKEMKNSGGARGIAIPVIEAALHCYAKGIADKPINTLIVPKSLKLETYYTPKRRFVSVRASSESGSTTAELRPKIRKAA